MVGAVLLACGIRRRGEKQRAAILPWLPPESAQYGPEARFPTLPVSEKSRGSEVLAGGSQPPLPTLDQQPSHQFIVTGELRALREEVERINNGNDVRVRGLVRELLDAEHRDPPLPEYVE